MRSSSTDSVTEATQKSSPSQATNHSALAPRMADIGAISKSASGRLAPALPMKSALYREYEKPSSLRDFVAKYGVEGAPPEAKFLAAKVMIEDCRKFSFGTLGWRENAEKRLKDGAPTKDAQMASIAQIEKKCGGDWTSMLPSKDRGYELMRSPSQAGNSAAAAYLLADAVQTKSSAELADKVAQYLSSNDLPTIEQAMRSILTVGQRMGTLPLENGASANPFLFTHAARLAMCDLGQDCGAESLDVQGACAAGFCNVASLEDYIRLHSSTPNDFQEITRLRQLIFNSLLSGNKENVGWNVFSSIKG